MVDLEPVLPPADVAELKSLLEEHLAATGSPKAKRLLADWEGTLKKFVKVIPVDYKKALAILADEKKTGE